MIQGFRDEAGETAGGSKVIPEGSEGYVACGAAGGGGTDLMEHADLLEKA